MEDQAHSPGTSDNVSEGGSSEQRAVGADHTSIQRGDGKAEGDAGTTRRSGGWGDDNKHSEQTITFKDHQQRSYIWPFELCQSFDAIRPLLEEVYTLQDQQEHVEDIKQGRYEIQTDDGKIIIPSVWGAIVKPFSTIRIVFPSMGHWTTVDSDEDYTELFHRRSGDDVRRLDDIRVTFDVDDPKPSSSKSEGSSNEDDESEDSFETRSPAGNGYEISKQVGRPGPSHDDKEDNKLSFTVDTSITKKITTPSEGPASNNESPNVLEPQKDASETHRETLRITKATSVVVDSRNTIQIHILPGPENNHLRESVHITWYHISTSRLDYSRFRNVCLAIPNLSDRLHKLIWTTLKKIEDDKIKAFLNGMFIEPGTVIRGDESGQLDSQSVIFSCIPYFDLQPLSRKPSAGLGGRLFPSRTLMQSYYPYEPTWERDADQAYRKFGNDRSGNVINVPNLWMLNIGSNIVVTCGYKPLSQELVKSIEIVKENLERLGAENTRECLTNIRLTDWDGRVLLFPLNACRSYFQMEQKVRELKLAKREGMGHKSLRLVRRDSDGEKKAAPGDWRKLIQRTDLIFIDLALVEDHKAKGLENISTDNDISHLLTLSTSSVPPFFRWPYTAMSDTSKQTARTPGLIPSEVSRMMHCLEHAEKSMMAETLPAYQTFNAVDKTFTSTTFYRSLPEGTQRGVQAEFLSLRHKSIQARGLASVVTQHQVVIDAQCAKIMERSTVIFEVICSTLKLFVDDLDNSVLLRKVWGALANIPKLATIIKERGALEPDPDEYSDPHWKHPLMTKRAWFIRNNVKDKFIQAPEADDKFKRSVGRCRRCQSFEPFNSPEAARGHLQKHVKLLSEAGQVKIAATSNSLPHFGQSAHEPVQLPNLKDWVVNYEQVKREETNAGALAILTQACGIAEKLFILAKELAEGVQNEDGAMSELYTLPRQLVEAFRKTLVFYLAIERALHYTEESYQKDNLLEDEYDPTHLPFSEESLGVLKSFGKGAWNCLMMARVELCGMVASTAPLDVLSHLSLGPEYICAWLMRRLLVKPLQGHMTVGDMYREYLSTVQFQVNHRPGKRLLRSINLLQEELQVLSEVNSWQTKLIQNYIRILDDTSYGRNIPSRRAAFPYERMLLRSCLENLSLACKEYSELVRRCGPLSDSTKQSLEINEEDHGKAIMVFTLVTVIFLPLSFVTSYLGMNTADIRDMDNRQSIFWIIALPLTLVTMGTCLFIGYNGDELRDAISSFYRAVTGKQNRSTSARGISVAQRERARKLQGTSSSSLDVNSLADDAEYASPRLEYQTDDYGSYPLMAAYNEQVSSPLYAPEAVESTSFKMSMPPLRAASQPTSYTEPISPAQGLRPTYVSIKKRYLDEASLRFFGYPYGTNEDDPESFLIKQILSDQEIRMLFEDTERRRYGLDGGRKEMYEGVYDRPGGVERLERAGNAMPPPRVGFPRLSSRIGFPPAPRAGFPPPRLGFSPVYEGEQDADGDEAGVQEYTWHRKRSQKAPERRGWGARVNKRAFREGGYS